MKKSSVVVLALAMTAAGCSGPTETAAPTASTVSAEVPIEATPEVSEDAPTDTEVVEGEGMELPTWTTGDQPATFVCTSPELEGVIYTIPLPVNESHEAIVKMEALRTEVGVEEAPSYVVVEIDASKAGQDVQRAGLYTASWATTDFETVEALSTGDLVDKWREAIDIDDGDVDLYNRTVDVGNSLLNTEPNRGAKGFKLLALDAPVESVVAPMIQPDGFTMIPCDLG